MNIDASQATVRPVNPPTVIFLTQSGALEFKNFIKL